MPDGVGRARVQGQLPYVGPWYRQGGTNVPDQHGSSWSYPPRRPAAYTPSGEKDGHLFARMASREGSKVMLQFAEALYGLYAGEREGQGLVEYALLLGFIAVTMLVVLAFFKDRLLIVYSRIGNSMPAS